MEVVFADGRNRHRLPAHLGNSAARAARKQQPDGLRLAWGPRIHHQTLHVARGLAPLCRVQQPECQRGTGRMENRLSSILLAAALLSGCSWFHRGDKAPAPVPVTVEEPQANPSIIEPQVSRRVVKTPKIKSKDFEVGAYFGALSIQDFGTNPVYGVRAAYHVTEDLFLESYAARSQAGLSSLEDVFPNITVVSNSG